MNKRSRSRFISGGGATDRGINITRATMLALFGVVAARLVYLQVFEADELAEAAESQRTNSITLHAKRGTIYDRNGNVLAMSVDCQTIYANPTVIDDPSGVANVLAEYLGGDSSDYLELLVEDTTFVYIEQRVDEDLAEELEAALDEADLSGIYFLDDTKRIYPYDDAGAQIIGYVGTEGTGLSGLEYQYDDILSGTDGEMIMETGLDGTPIAGGAYEITEAVDGSDLVISIDITIQAAAEEIIAEAVETYDSESGSAMVLDPTTGEVLAACSTPLPDFDNLTDDSSLNLKLVSSSYEPGSIFKVITTSIGFNLGLFDTETTYSVPVQILVGEDYVTDDDSRSETMSMTIREMLRRSSNVAMAQLVQEVIGAEAFAEGVEDFGIGSLTGIDFPGETTGIVKTYDEYDGSTAGSMAFGQGVSIPMIQIVRAYSAVANKGVAMTPHFVVSIDGEAVDWGEGTEIISEDAAAMEIDIMRTVMEEGTGTNGQVEGYDIAGKTGTGEQADEEGGYEEYTYYSSLCGFANADDPQVLVYAGLEGTSYLAKSSAAYAFADIMSEAVSVLGVPTVEDDDEDSEDDEEDDEE